ncbi:MAG: mannose-1-phosphate guanylyltransferase [Polyangia bacterium]
MREPVYALILAGGGGTRLWPASRRRRPKQLLTLGGRESLLRASFRRATKIFGAEHTLVVTAADQAEAVGHELPDLPPANLIAEPAARNTGPAVGLGAVAVARRAGKGALLAVLPSDAFVADEPAFAEVLGKASAHAGETIVTIGVKPTRPETGYGYLERGELVRDGVYRVARFVEKPDAATAVRYLADPGFLWNAGMFFFSAERLLAEVRSHLPDLATILDELYAAPDLGKAAAERYPAAPKISIDYGIMEKASGLRVVAGDFGWNDVGSWSALADIRAQDSAGNVVAGDVVASGVSGSVLVSEPGAPLLGVVGVDDVVVVATRDAVLVVRKDRAQEVRAVVAALAAAKRDELL